VHRALAYTGELRVDDPDGIVVDARWVPVDDCAGPLGTCPQWVREPVVEWLAERWTDRRSFGYELTGIDRASLVVTRR
jgi:hypothetical protein